MWNRLKSILVFSLLAFFICSFIVTKDTALNKKKIKKVKVSGVVLVSGSYCGGAAPSQELLDEIQRKKPYANQTLYVRKGKENNVSSKIVMTIKSDSLGRFSFFIAPGTYCLVDESKKDNKYIKSLMSKYSKKTDHHQAIDTNCIKNWIKQPDAVLVVGEKNIDNVEVSYLQKCFYNNIPCVVYTGPLPQ